MKLLFFLPFVLPSFCGLAQQDYAGLHDTVFRSGQVLQLEQEPRFSLCTGWSGQQVDDHTLVLLDSLAAFMVRHPQVRIEIGMHTDARGTAEGNRDVSQQRAEVLKQLLVERTIPAERLTAVGYGESSPRTVFLTNAGYVLFLTDEDSVKPCVLSESYINAFKQDARLYEQLHQYNRRMEVRVL